MCSIVAKKAWSWIAGRLSVLGLLASVLGAGPPEVREVRVPASKVTSYFPPGTPLRIMSESEYRDLLGRAFQGAWNSESPNAPELVNARHQARWDGGALLGRSEFTVRHQGPKPAFLPLEPWTPSVRVLDPSGRFRTLADGRSALWIDQSGESRIQVEWTVGGRPGSRDRVFDLSLPSVAVSRLDLDLPRGMKPEILHGLLVTSHPADEPDRVVWSFDGAEAALTVQIRPEDATHSGPSTVSAWISGPTRIEVSEASATFEADWTAVLAPSGVRTLGLEFDPGLRFVRLDGADVVSVRTEPDGEATRIFVDLATSAETLTRFQIHAMSRVPDEGQWQVPSARPLRAAWTGGRTVVWVGPSRVVKGQKPRNGWLVPDVNLEKELTARGGQVLVYESLAPRSVADIDFASPSASGSVSIRGNLNTSQESPTLDAVFTWKLDHGPLLSLPIDLPAGWTPDSVQVLGLDEPTSWRLEPRPGSEQRIVIQPPPYLDPAASVSVRLTAEADGPLAQNLRVPRLRPGFGRVAEDLWFATCAPGSSLTPIRARGLAWVDPSAAGASEESPQTESSRLSWRWTDPDGILEMRRQPDPGTVSGECWTGVRVYADRTEVDWYVWIRSVRAGVSSVCLQSPLAPGEIPEWYVLGDESGLPRDLKPVEDADRTRFSIPAGETAFRVSLPQGLATDTPVILHARLPARPAGDSRIPMVSLPRVEHARGCVLVSVEDPLLATMNAEGLVATDRTLAQSVFTSHFGSLMDLSPNRFLKLRPAQAFDYGSEGGTLDLTCTRMDLVESEGYLSEVVLSTVHGGTSSRLRRLLVRIPAWQSQDLDVTMPPGTQLERAMLDGRSVVPRTDQGRLRFELAPGPSDAPQRELILDYRETALKALARSGEVSISWPRFSLPVLSTSVILDRTPSLLVEAAGDAFESTDPSAREAGPRMDFQVWQQALSSAQNRGLVRDLELRDQKIGPWSMTLGERLIQLDRVDRPVVVDRQAMEDAGLGPRSRPQNTQPDSDAPASVLDLGLVAVPVGRIVLISTPEARPDLPGGPLSGRSTRAAWESSLEEAASRGSDPTDRFQSVARWRGASTPEGRPLERPGAAHPRWSKVGPPPAQFRFEARSELSKTAGMIGVSSAVLALGLWLRGGARASRLILFGVILGAVALAVLMRKHGLSGWPSGLVLGWLGSLAFWVGQGLRPVRRLRTETSVARAGSSSSARAISSGSVSVLILALGLSHFAPSLLAFEDEQPAPILVLVPYDQIPDPSSPGPRFVLRLTDFEMLQALARSSPPSRSMPGISATSVRHSVEVQQEDQVLLSSEYLLVHSGSEPSTWSIPLGLGREWTATLDDTPVPVRVETEAQQARVVVEGDGSHRLVLTRRIEMVSRDTLQTPILPSALGRLEVTGQVPGRRVEVTGAVGPVEFMDNKALAYLGYTSSITLRWVEQDRDPEGQLGTVDGLLLWNVEPSGDRIEARLSFRSTEPRSELRLALEPGLEVRSASFSGWRDASWEGTPEHPIWVAPATPPLPDGSVVTMEFWRPAPISNPGEASPRPAPQIEVLDVEASSGILAVRVVPGWSAQFVPPIGHDPILERIFLGSWSLEGRTPPGVETALTWKPRPTLQILAAPSPPRLSVRPSVLLEIERGRVSFQGELICEGAQAPVSEIEVRIPSTLQVVSVEADHLSGWTRFSKDHLRLRFQVLDASDRTIRVSGWLPVESDPLVSKTRPRELPVPWIAVEGASEEPGSLLIQHAPGLRPVIRDSSGLTAGPSTLPLSTLSDRLLFRTAGLPPTGLLVWNEDGPRASVSLFSHLLFRPGRADWTCLVRYRSLGGPTRSIRMTLPESWSSLLQVESLQGDVDVEVSTDGERSTLDITLDNPIWGEHELVIRAHRPFQGERMLFPDLVPLGNGQVKSWIAWTNFSGWALVAEGSAGIQPVDPSRFEGAGLPVPTSSDLRAYQVLRTGWRLAIQSPAGPVASGDDSESRSVSLEDVECVLAPDGWITGRCRFLVESGSAPFLSLSMPVSARPLSALVDSTPVHPLMSPDGRLLIPLGEASAPVVLLLWDQPSVPSAPTQSLAIPAPTSSPTPLTLVVHAPSDTVLTPPSTLKRDVGLEIEVERYENSSNRLVQGLAQFDRSSVRHRSKLLASLVSLELCARSALRLAQAPGTGQETWSVELQRALVERIAQARSNLQEVLRAAGLDDYLDAARNRVGLGPLDPKSDRSEIAEPPLDFRLLHLGHPSWYRGTVNARDGAVAFSVKPAPTRAWNLDVDTILTLTGLLGASLILTWLSTPGRPLRLLVVTLLCVTLTVPLHLSLPVYGTLMAFVALGALVRPPRGESATVAVE